MQLIRYATHERKTVIQKNTLLTLQAVFHMEKYNILPEPLFHYFSTNLQIPDL